jgi:ABC-type transporter Mla subunit MlaD
MKTEIKVGFFVFFSFLILVFSIVYLGRSTFSAVGKEYEVTFNFLNDLKPGSNIKVAGGIPVGYVKEINLDKTRVKVKIWIKKDFPISNQVNFTILGEGFLGEKYINIGFKSNEEMMEKEIKEIEENSIIAGNDMIAFDQVVKEVYDIGKKLNETLDSVNFMLNGITKRKDIEKITKGTINLLSETEKLISENKGNIESVIKEAVSGVKTINTLLNSELPKMIKNANSSILGVTGDLSELMKELKNILGAVKRGEGLLGKAMVDQQLSKDLEETIINLKKITEKILVHPLLSPEKKSKESTIWRNN